MDGETEPVATGPGLLLALDRRPGATLHGQIEYGLREQVRSGRLAPGSRVPSSRALAAELGVSRGVVLEAYAQLVAEGYLTSSRGAPTRVARALLSERPPLPAISLSSHRRYEFDPGICDLAAFPRERWIRSLRAALRVAPFEQLGQPDPRGIPQLRNQLMDYLGRTRGAAPEPEHTLICSGFTQGFSMLCRALHARGVERLAIEQPGFPRHRLIAEQAGLQTAPIRVDGAGIDVTALADADCEAVVVTPAHQFPSGAVLSSERRASLLEWADEEDALIVEDDYDSELRYDRMPVGALQGLAPERVCHIGSLSKRLAAGVGLGWLLSPSWLTGVLTYEKGTADGGVSVLEQFALTDFIARGELDRHLRRVRLRYRQRRARLLAALAASVPVARAIGIPAGLFVTVLLEDENLREDAVLSAAAARAVALEGLTTCRHGEDGPPGLVLGYANLSDRTTREGIQLLAEAVETATR